MANTYLTISMITYAMLPILHNNLIAGKKVSRKYDDQFAKSGGKIGDTLNIRKPPRYQVNKGATFIGQDYQDERVQLVVNQHDQIGVEFVNDDMTLSLDDFAGRVLNPQLVPMANSIDVFILSLFGGVWNTTGTPGTVASTSTPFLQAKTKLVNNAAAMDTDWPMLVTPDVDASLSDGLAGRFNPQKDISGLYLKGSMGPFAGWDFYDSQNMPVQTTGAWQASNPGAGLVVASAGQTGASINCSGATVSITGLGKQNDVVQFAGVYMVNPITQQNNGKLQDFVLTSDVNSDGGGLFTLNINPPIILTGKNQTVSASPGNGAQVFVYGTATVASVASQTSPQCMGWSSDGITLAMVDLAQPGKSQGVEAMRVSDPDLGFSLLFMRGFDIRGYSNISRVDSLYGAVLTRPEHCVRVAS